MYSTPSHPVDCKIWLDFISIHELTEPTFKKKTISFRLIFLPKLFQKSTVLHLCCQNILGEGGSQPQFLLKFCIYHFKFLFTNFQYPSLKKKHYPKEDILNFWISCINSAGMGSWISSRTPTQLSQLNNKCFILTQKTIILLPLW